MPAKLKHGVIGSMGGKREGAGRKPSWFKIACEEELKKDKHKAIKLIGRIARGEQTFEKVFNSDNGIVTAIIKPSASEIIDAAEFLRDSGFGKPVQALSGIDENGKNVPLNIHLVNYAQH